MRKSRRAASAFAWGAAFAAVICAIAFAAWALFFKTPEVAGTWTGQKSDGSVSQTVSYTFSPDRTYSLTSKSENRGVVTGSTVRGTWSLKGGKLELVPETVSFESAGQAAELSAAELGQGSESYESTVSGDGKTLTLRSEQTGEETALALDEAPEGF